MSGATSPQQVDGPALMVDICVAIKERGWWLACNPKDRAQAVDSMEEVFENEKWRWPEMVPLMLHPKVPEGRIGFWNPDAGALTGLVSNATRSKKGLGRIGKIWLPGHEPN